MFKDNYDLSLVKLRCINIVHERRYVKLATYLGASELETAKFQPSRF